MSRLNDASAATDGANHLVINDLGIKGRFDHAGSASGSQFDIAGGILAAAAIRGAMTVVANA
jgi:hypothetical protein